MLSILRSLLFGCSHSRITFPITPKAGTRPNAETHVTCLDCGKEFKYDWAGMHMRPAELANGQQSDQSAQVAFCERTPATRK